VIDRSGRGIEIAGGIKKTELEGVKKEQERGQRELDGW
jgi:hypothetical protein